MAGSLVWSDIVACAPYLSTVAAPMQTLILAEVNTTLDEAVFGGPNAPKLNLARVYLGAHMGTLLQRGILAAAGGPIGPVSASTASKLSRSYAVPAAKLTAHASTVWGQLFDGLVATTSAAIRVVVS